MTSPNICFIGAGNMASSLIGGLINDRFPADRITACDIDDNRLLQLKSEFAINTTSDNNAAVKQASIIVLAVKPQVLQPVCRALPRPRHGPLFISIAAGIRASDIDRWLGGGQALVRCMPNTPALIGLGASALYANEAVEEQQRLQAERILAATGITVWVSDESELDAVTAVSGSGPAYFFLFIEALQNAAMQLGLSQQTAERLARQTALGAATMAIDGDVVQLRQQVTSRGGTTEQAIHTFQQHGLQQLVLDAVRAAAHRSEQLADQLGKDSE